MINRLRLVLFLLLFGVVCRLAVAQTDDFARRAAVVLAGYTNRPLPPAMDSGTWVDSERWCVAHACLEAGVRLDEANRYFAEIRPVSLWHGLVADTDIQITDLLWTYLRFSTSERLHPAAREHLLAFFRAWHVPNPDRNRRADEAYEWPAEYTENHSLNILAAAYLVDTVLQRDRTRHSALLQQFLFDRARWGWNEFNSPAYALVTVKVLGLLAAAAPDPALASAARMHLDLIALDFASVGLRTWRGMPHARGYGSETSNAGNSLNDVARFWFGDAGARQTPGNPFLLHLITGSYRPPPLADRWLRDPETRGRYATRKTVTQGPGKQRIPLVAWVTPAVTMASAQGSGSYYDGSYCSISFASAPEAVVIARDGKRYNNLQWRNTLAAFGTVSWHGPLKRVTSATGDRSIGGDDHAWVGQLDLTPDVHLLMVAETSDYADQAAFQRALEALHARFEQGNLNWTAPDGREIRMANERVGDHWRMTGAWANGEPLRTDANMLFDTPFLRSVRDSAVVEALDGAVRWTYDFRDPQHTFVIRTAQAGLTPVPPNHTNGPLGIAFQYIPPGEFPLGSGLTEGRLNERPEHWVNLDGFYISTTEITVGQYRRFLADNGGASALPDWYWKEWGKTDAYPMTWVSWDEATAFCAWLSKTTQCGIRLPTEAEWEKAARGYAHQRYPWGDEYDGTEAGTPNGTYAPAGEHPRDVSPFGVRGMAGNAWEWCADWYAADAYGAPPARNPTGPSQGTERVVRGCGWNFDPDTFRCSYRSALRPSERAVHIGFRIVRAPLIDRKAGTPQ